MLTAKGLLGEARTRHAELAIAEQALATPTIRALVRGAAGRRAATTTRPPQLPPRPPP